MKYKKLTKEQIIISLDRLTRFKNTKEKYLRVFSDIISSNLIEPKLKKSDILSLDYSEITKIAETIINESLPEINFDTSINILLKDYENSVFNNDNETQKFLNNNIKYQNAINYINEDSPINLKWLKTIINNKIDLKLLPKLREQNLLKFPIERVILAEGITEEILLPAFSKFLGHDFYQKGIQIIAAGGKNQVVKMYYKLAEELKIPIYVLLDKDAEDNINQIKPKLRNIDKIHLVSCGEFEDLLPHELIIKTVNKHFENFLSITEEDLNKNEGLNTAKILAEIYRTKGLHEFKKAEFAKLVRSNIETQSDISEEIRTIIQEISR